MSFQTIGRYCRVLNSKMTTFKVPAMALTLRGQKLSWPSFLQQKQIIVNLSLNSQLLIKRIYP